MSSGGYDSPHLPSSYSGYGPRRSSGQLPASYERPSNLPPRRTSSPGSSSRRYVPYERGPRAGPSLYPSDYQNVYRPNGANVYRPDYDSYYSRSPTPDRYPSASSRGPPEPESWDRPSSWQQTLTSPNWPERKPLPPSPTASIPRERNRERDDALATRAFEPSDAWKQTHDRPGRGDTAGPSSIHSDHRSRSNQDHSPERASRPDRASYYQAGGDRYRPVPRQWDSYSPTRPEHNSYRPQYDNPSSWTHNLYLCDSASPAHSYRRDSLNATHTRTSDHYETSYNGRHISASRSGGSLSPRHRDRSPPVRRGRRSPSRDRSYYNGHSAYGSDSSYRRRYSSRDDRERTPSRKFSSRSSSRSSIASTHPSDNEKPAASAHYPEPILANLGINGPMGRESSKPPGPQATDQKDPDATTNGHGPSAKDTKADPRPTSHMPAKQQKSDVPSAAAILANAKLPSKPLPYRPLKPVPATADSRVPLQAKGKSDDNIPGLGTGIEPKAPVAQDSKTRPSPKAPAPTLPAPTPTPASTSASPSVSKPASSAASKPAPPAASNPAPPAAPKPVPPTASQTAPSAASRPAPSPVSPLTPRPVSRPTPSSISQPTPITPQPFPSRKKVEQRKVTPEPRNAPEPAKVIAVVVDEPPPSANLARVTQPPTKANVPKAESAVPVPPSNSSPVERAPTAASSPEPIDLATEIPKLAEAKSIKEALRAVVMTRLMCDRQTREERVNPVLAANRVIAPKPEVHSNTSPEDVIEEVYSGGHLEDRMRAFEAAKPSLVEFFHQRQALITEKVNSLSEEYISLHEKWRAHCAALNAQSKALAAETEIAQPTGRTTRRTAATLTDAVRSDLEMEQIIASLGYDEATDPNHLCLRNVATIPDMICVTKGKIEYLFDDTNNRVENPDGYYAPETGMHDWTDTEREIFIDKFACYPKQFGIIADFLPNKTAAQCVAFYYLHKHRHIDFRKVVSQLAPNKRRRRGTGKKKGNALLADIAQHDAQVQREAGSPAGGRSTRGRKGMPPPDSRKPGSVAGRRQVSSVLQQLEGTPVSTPTPEPDAPKPKRGRGRPPNPKPVSKPASRTVSVVSLDEGEQDAVSDDGRPSKRQKRGRKVKSAAIISEDADGTSTPNTEAVTPHPTPAIDDQAKDKEKDKEKQKEKEKEKAAALPAGDKKVLPPLPKRATVTAITSSTTAGEDPNAKKVDAQDKSAKTVSIQETEKAQAPKKVATLAPVSAASASASGSKPKDQPAPPARTTNGAASSSTTASAPHPAQARAPLLPSADPPMASLSPPPPSFRPKPPLPSSSTPTTTTADSASADNPNGKEKTRDLPDILKSWGSIMTRKPPPPPPPSRPRAAQGKSNEGRYYPSKAYVPNSPVLGGMELPPEEGSRSGANGAGAGAQSYAAIAASSSASAPVPTNTPGYAPIAPAATSASAGPYAHLQGYAYPPRGAVYGPLPPPGSRVYPTTTVPGAGAGTKGAGAGGAGGEGGRQGYYQHYPQR